MTTPEPAPDAAEALAKWLCRDDLSLYHADRTDDFPCSECQQKARAILASPALDAVKAEARAEVIDTLDAMSGDPDWQGQAPSMGFRATLDQELTERPGHLVGHLAQGWADDEPLVEAVERHFIDTDEPICDTLRALAAALAPTADTNPGDAT